MSKKPFAGGQAAAAVAAGSEAAATASTSSEVAQPKNAINIFLANDPIEMIFRRAPWGLAGMDGTDDTALVPEVEAERERHLTAVA